jgi:pimeloyl-ACP methyl ester carboxylesterase
MKESAIRFGRQRSLVGVFTEPEETPHRQLAVIMLNAGLLHHVGPNRLYVRLARHLARRGLAVFRFDLSGTGDSDARSDHLSFEQGIIDDARQAMCTLTKSYGIKHFIFVGHCSGAAQSFVMTLEDNRVVGAVLINPQSERQDWREYDRKRKVQRYYQNYYGKQVLTDANHWLKFLTGKVDYRSVFRNVFKDFVWSKIATALFKARSKLETQIIQDDPIQKRVLEGLRQLGARQTPLLFIYSAGSSGLEQSQILLGKEFDELVNINQVRMVTVEGADHTFTLRASQDCVLEIIGDWCIPLMNSLPTPQSQMIEELIL